MADLALAVDIGGTKLAAGLVRSDGTLVVRAQRPTPKTPNRLGPTGEPGATRGTREETGAEVHGDGAAAPIADPDAAEQLWGELEELVRSVIAAAPDSDRLVVCGAGCGGPMSPGGEEVSPLNIAAWRSFPLRTRLSGLTGLPTYVDNDAKALALGEGWVGAAMGERNYIAMVISTGVGGGIVLDGRLLEGNYGNAGHIGHVVVEPDGRPCECGGQGCLEAEASGTALAQMSGGPAREASPEMRARAGTLVGRAVASVINLLDLRLAVVSGSVALGFGAPFFRAAQAEVDARCGLDFTLGARVVPGGLGDRGPLIGAGRVGWLGSRWEGSGWEGSGWEGLGE